MRFFHSLWFVLNLFASLTAGAKPAVPPGCDACNLHIEHLDRPIKLAGTWLFTRDDLPANKEVTADTSSWRLAKAPGPWMNIYDDRSNFPVGWYRGSFNFNPALAGREVVLLVNAYLGRVAVYVDGEEIYRRPQRANVETYYANQPIPVRFTIKGPQHVIALRLETPLMSGIYQLPFELRPYDAHDAGLVFYQAWGGELRVLAGCVVLIFGLFFLGVHARTRHSLHWTVALGSLGIVPYFAAGSDLLLRVVEPETLLYLQFVGLGAVFMFHVFCQHFYKFMPRFTLVLGGLHLLLGASIGAMAVWPHLDLLQILRSLMFLMNMVVAISSMAMLWRALPHKRPGVLPLFVAMSAFFLAGIHDLMVALGVIQSMMLMPPAVLGVVATMLYVACSSLAQAMVDNQRLVKDLKSLSDNLEQLVAQRTAQLRQKAQDIRSLMQHLPLGVLTLTEGLRVHHEYSAQVEALLETQDIAGRNAMELLFTDSRPIGTDLAQVEAALSHCMGQQRENFESHAQKLPSEMEKTLLDGRIKTLALNWSPLYNEHDVVDKLMLCIQDITPLKQREQESALQHHELTRIREVLAVSQEKFQDFMDSCGRLLEDCRRLLTEAPDKRMEVSHPLLRHMHAIKGEARNLRFVQLTQLAHSLELAYHDQLRTDISVPWQSNELLARVSALRAALDDYVRINEQVLGRKGPGRRGSVAKYLMVEKDQVDQSLQLLGSVDLNDATAMRGAINQVALSLNLVGADRLDDVLVGLLDTLPLLASELGKETPVMKIEDHGLMVRSQVHSLLRHVFGHLLHNTMDHGLEPAAERLAHGKPVAGRIDLHLDHRGDKLCLSLRDDGRGLAIGRLRKRAVAQQLLTTSQARSAAAVAQTIFLPGVSMIERGTDAAGRGVGMGAVRDLLKKEGGDIDLRFLTEREADYRPFELMITLPAKFVVQPGAASGRRPSMGASASTS